MLSGIASYLFGSAPEATEVEQQEEKPKETGSPVHQALKTVAAEDEWMLVDKSSRGNSPLRLVATNPMENLLIEHPSMSVYGARGRPSSTGHQSDISESSNEVNMTDTTPSTSKRGKVPKTRAVTALPPRRPRAVAARVGLLAQVQNVRSMQSSQKKKEARKISKKNMDRSNRVQHQQSSCRQHRRKHYMLRPSGANNDRKTHT